MIAKELRSHILDFRLQLAEDGEIERLMDSLRVEKELLNNEMVHEDAVEEQVEKSHLIMLKASEEGQIILVNSDESARQMEEDAREFGIALSYQDVQIGNEQDVHGMRFPNGALVDGLNEALVNNLKEDYAVPIEGGIVH